MVNVSSEVFGSFLGWAKKKRKSIEIKIKH